MRWQAEVAARNSFRGSLTRAVEQPGLSAEFIFAPDARRRGDEAQELISAVAESPLKCRSAGGATY